ncbi:MAG: MFS transporter [Burkholderiales bacterium]|nr:MFS transporter [Burkholderiales bacterium]
MADFNPVAVATAATESRESPYAWARLLASLLMMTIGGSGMYAVTVVLPRIQQEFGVARADASLPYTLTMIGFGVGGVLMGRLADRFGVITPVLLGTFGLSGGFIVAGLAGSLSQFALAQGLLIGALGTSATFAPLVADTALWFTRRRGIALGICMSGNYVAGAVWPPIVQHFVEAAGWRATYIGIGVFCLVSMLPLALMLRRRPPALAQVASPPAAAAPASQALPAPPAAERPLGLSPGMLQSLLCVAGVACCVAMSMPQVHIVAYCGDLGYGAARGAQMLSLMLGMGVVSRLASGWISDHIGGLRTLLLGSVLQGVALLMFLLDNGVASLFIISAMFGLFQGGIVPSYALIVREYFTPRQAGARVGVVLMATLLGMALGGWMSGAIFDATGSYRAAFLNGLAWNLLNVSIVLTLLWRARRTTGSRSDALSLRGGNA